MQLYSSLLYKLNSSRILHKIRINRPVLSFLHDIIATFISFQFSLFLRLGDDIFLLPVSLVAYNSLSYVLIAAAVFFAKHNYRVMWRYASLGDLFSIILSVSYITVLFIPVLALFSAVNMRVPFSTPLINWFVLSAMLGGPRIAYRIYKQKRKKLLPNVLQESTKSAIIIGANDQTEIFIRELLRQNDCTYDLKGILGTRPIQKGEKIHGIEIIGTLTDLEDIIIDFQNKNDKINLLIVADEKINGKQMHALLNLANQLHVQLTCIPRISDITTPSLKPRLRPIAIEDLLGRDQTSLDIKSMKEMIYNKKVLITGAGGTIGGELVRQIASFNPSDICLVDHSEYLLYLTDLALSESHPDLKKEACLTDITSRGRVREVIKNFQPNLVFHAAALKHVPLVEKNPSQGLNTNVIGTKNVADACREFKVSAMLLISTDKAINPTSVMGASKRLAESYCQALDTVEHNNPNGTRFVCVRFGNVLGSSGSVIPLFRRQIEKGGPVTVTHPEMTRYFMTVKEAVELVLQAMTISLSAKVKGGKVFVLDMGEPIKILDMARQMIRLAGLQEDIDIPIAFTGLRPGEKLFEELFHESEALLPTNNPSIMLGAPRTTDLSFLNTALGDLEQAINRQDDERALKLLCALVPEYKADKLSYFEA